MKSLFLRIFLWFCGATAAIVCVIGAGFLLDSPGALMTNWRDLGHGAIISSGRISIESYERGGQAEVARYFRSLAQDLGWRATLFDSSAHELSGSGFSPGTTAIADLLSRSEGEVAIFARQRCAGVQLRSPRGRAYVFLAIMPPREAGFWGRAFVGSFIVAGCFLCYLLARHVTQPAVHLRSLTSRFSRGDLAARITLPSLLERKDEYGELARDFNRMASRIESLIKAQQRLIADVSHELRSPITRLRLALGLMRRNKEGDLRTSLARMEREVERLNVLIAQLLTLSRLECLDQPPPMEPIDLSALVQEIAVDADFEATSMDRSVRLVECAACSMLGAADLLRSAVENAVRNAIKYTAPGTHVIVRLVRANGNRTATIMVEDCGPGVPDRDLPHVFEPFYRADESRERQSGGAGLGLAITQQVVTLHGGSVGAANRESGGLELRITLPVSDAF